MDYVISLFVGLILGIILTANSNRTMIELYTEKPVCIELEVDLNKKVEKCYKLKEMEN